MLIVSLSFSSCYTYKPMMSKKDANAGNVSEMIAKVTPGKKYRFTLKTGNYLYMKVIRVEEGNILGSNYVLRDMTKTERLDRGDSILVNQENIVDIRKKEISAGKTAGAFAIPLFCLYVASWISFANTINGYSK